MVRVDVGAAGGLQADGDAVAGLGVEPPVVAVVAVEEGAEAEAR